MSKKILGLLVIAGAILLSLAAGSYDHNQTARYHQHLEEPKPALPSADGGAFHTHLPLIRLVTGGQPLPGEAMDGRTISAILEVRSAEDGDNSLSDAPAFVSDIALRYRGNTSLLFDKKPYRIKLLDAEGASIAHEMLGMPKEDEWILNGPFLDKSLLRSYMLMNISGEVMEHTPEVRYCELFVDNTYQGVYVMMKASPAHK